MSDQPSLEDFSARIGNWLLETHADQSRWQLKEGNPLGATLHESPRNENRSLTLIGIDPAGTLGTNFVIQRSRATEYLADLGNGADSTPQPFYTLLVNTSAHPDVWTSLELSGTVASQLYSSLSKLASVAASDIQRDVLEQVTELAGRDL